MADLSEYNVPWKSDIDDGLINQNFLDLGYYQNSAQKVISPFIWQYAGIESYIPPQTTINALNETQRNNIAGVIYTMMNRKWTRLWELYNLEYNPIQNYNITETENIDTETSNTATNTGTVSDAHTGTITNVSDTDTTETGTVTDAGSDTRDNGLYGFNSSSSVGSDTSSGTNTNTQTNNLAGTNDTTTTETRNTTDTETRNLNARNDGTADTVRSRVMSGNIGVTTTQRMFESELEIWKWNFFKTVFQDIDNICCLDIY